MHPLGAFGRRVIGAAWRFDQHVQAHQQAERVLAAIVVDDCLVDDERAADWQSRISLVDQRPFLIEIPIVQHMAHDQHVGLRERVGKEVAGLER